MRASPVHIDVNAKELLSLNPLVYSAKQTKRERERLNQDALATEELQEAIIIGRGRR